MNENIMSNSCQKEVCSVSEMSQSLGLSRSRFYQLLEKNKLPQPVYDIRTRRPFYTRHLQDICSQIRQTNIAYDGSPILFYAPRKKPSSKPRMPSMVKTDSDPIQKSHEYEELVSALLSMRVKADANSVAGAIKVLYPDGLPKDIDEGVILRDLYRHLKENA